MKPPAPQHAPLPSRGHLPVKKSRRVPEGKKSGPVGRPLKFSEPSRPVTLTLPESILKGLQQIHQDRAQAIVKLAAAWLKQAQPSPPKVQIVEMAANTGLLVVGRCEALRSIPFLHLVEVAPDRFLLALDPGNDFKTLELALQDVLDDLPGDAAEEQDLILQLLGHIRQVRKAERVSMAEILFVKLSGKRPGMARHGLIQAVAWLSALMA
jgi:hypothetical protein